MAVKKILVWPNSELSKTAAPVEHLDEALKELVQDLFDTLGAAGGIGLAATQIGVHKRVIVLDIISNNYYGAMINPEVEFISDIKDEKEEGCLSVPGQFGKVSRPFNIRVKFITPDGEHKTQAYEDLAARCILHEIDHLNGKVFVGYLGQASKDLIRGKMKKFGPSYLPGEHHEEQKND